MTPEHALSDPHKYIFVKIIPKETVWGDGIGMSILQLRNEHE